MGTFLTFLGYFLAIIWLLISFFVYACAKDEKAHKDGGWKLFVLCAVFLLITAVYCGISAHMIP
jgi:hypothetical protein